MAVSTMPTVIHELKMMSKSGYTLSSNNYGSLTADVPSGYKFLCWCNVVSQGWVGWMTISNPTAATSSFFTSWAENERLFRGDYIVYK